MFIQLPSVIGQPVICRVVLHVWEFAITALSLNLLKERKIHLQANLGFIWRRGRRVANLAEARTPTCEVLNVLRGRRRLYLAAHSLPCCSGFPSLMLRVSSRQRGVALGTPKNMLLFAFCDLLLPNLSQWPQ